MPRGLKYFTISAAKALVATLVAVSCIASCSKDPEFARESVPIVKASRQPIPTEETRHVLLLYSAGFNSLSAYLQKNIDSLCHGSVPGERRDDDVLLVYSHKTAAQGNYTTRTDPVLYRVFRNRTGELVRDTVKLFENQISASSTAMREVLSFVRDNYPAKDYGMIFSSHGSGWLPSGVYSTEDTSMELAMGRHGHVATDPWSFEIGPDGLGPDGKPATKSIGQMRVYDSSLSGHLSYEMNIKDFAKAIPMKLSYLYLDACLMGGIETAYELKDVCERLAFSPAEVLADGLMYQSVASRLFAPGHDVEGVCRDYFEYYDTQSGDYRSATVTLVDCSKLDALANVCKDIFAANREGLGRLNLYSVQGYFRYNKHWFFDLRDMLVKANVSTAELEAFDKALADCIIYAAATPKFIGFEINAYCGLSSYIPARGSAKLDEFYRTLAWNKATSLVE